MNTMNDRSRRKFLMNMAKAGTLLPFAGQMLGQSVFAAGTAQRVLFLYFPNGVLPSEWDAPTGAINTTNELNFCLGSLKSWHDKITVIKNMDITTGVGNGGHIGHMQGILTGNHQISSGSASIDHLIAEKLGNQGVLSLGVRNSSAGQTFISKPRNVDTASRPRPNNNPADVALKLASKINPIQISDIQKRIYETVLKDFDELSSATLEATKQSKIEQHKAALARLKDQTGSSVGECAFNATAIADTTDGSGGLTQQQKDQFPLIARAQIDNAVGAFACGLHRVATVQLACADEHVGMVNMFFDECWQMSKMLGVPESQRNWNENTAHTASHKDMKFYAGHMRWYNSMLAYTLEKLKEKGLLDDTLVVMFSETGDGTNHLTNGGACIVAGGAGGSLPMGRVINGNGNKNTHQLFGDVARYLGVTGLQESHWSGGVI